MNAFKAVRTPVERGISDKPRCGDFNGQRQCPRVKMPKKGAKSVATEAPSRPEQERYREQEKLQALFDTLAQRRGLASARRSKKEDETITD